MSFLYIVLFLCSRVWLSLAVVESEAPPGIYRKRLAARPREGGREGGWALGGCQLPGDSRAQSRVARALAAAHAVAVASSCPLLLLALHA